WPVRLPSTDQEFLLIAIRPGVSPSTGRCFAAPQPIVGTHRSRRRSSALSCSGQGGMTAATRSPAVITDRDDLPAAARAQILQYFQRRAVAEELDVAVGEGEIGASCMAAAEGAASIHQFPHISPGRHLVVDRRGGVKCDVCHNSRGSRYVSPL